MFIRENKNRSGSISVQVIEKIKGKNKVIFSVGSSTSPQKIELLKAKAKDYIENRRGALPLFTEPEDILIENFVSSLSNNSLRIVGPQMVLEPIYNEVFPFIDRNYFVDLVLCRVIYPGSKLRTVEYLSRHFNKSVSEQTIYRAMDDLDENFKVEIEKCTFKRAKKHATDIDLSVVFYDMTTLYFETETEDDLRKIGYSKDGKHQHPQIMIGLLVNTQGYPIAYDVFEGNTSETKTLIPVMERLIERFSINKPIIVADAGLLSKANLKALQDNGYKYILGGRIKNETREIKQNVLKLPVNPEQPAETPHPYGRLIISYSEKRKAKDWHNREKGLKRLENKVKNKKLTKQAINNRGYNKYLVLDGETTVTIDYEKFKEDSVWDGLKGYVTNTKLSAKDIIGNYGNLWKVEKAFRMSKTDLRFRPIFHRKETRIRAHLIICFAAYAIFKELELKIAEKKVGLSVQKAIDQLKEVQELTYQLPKSKQIKKQILKTNEYQQDLLSMSN